MRYTICARAFFRSRSSNPKTYLHYVQRKQSCRRRRQLPADAPQDLDDSSRITSARRPKISAPPPRRKRRDFRSAAEAKAEDLKNRAGEYYDQARHQAEEYYGQARDRARTLPAGWRSLRARKSAAGAGHGAWAPALCSGSSSAASLPPRGGRLMPQPTTEDQRDAAGTGPSGTSPGCSAPRRVISRRAWNSPGSESKEALVHYAIIIGLAIVSLVVILFGYFFFCFGLIFSIAALFPCAACLDLDHLRSLRCCTSAPPRRRC